MVSGKGTAIFSDKVCRKIGTTFVRKFCVTRKCSGKSVGHTLLAQNNAVHECNSLECDTTRHSPAM